MNRLLAISILFLAIKANAQSSQILDNMKIVVPESANRSISFTNKEAAFYYTQSHYNNHKEYAWFEGMNVSKNRIFQGYNLYSDGKMLDNSDSKVTVYPYKLVRQFPNGLNEELWLFDNRNIIEVNIKGSSKSIGIGLKGKGVELLNQNSSIAYFKSIEGNYIIGVSAKNPSTIKASAENIISETKAEGFFIAVGKTVEAIDSLLYETRESCNALKNERIKRLENILTRNVYLSSSDTTLFSALNWLEVTTDQLVTRQQGYGIYAGLPWFNEYWGRDEFISFAGAVLIPGEFKIAKQILLSFAKYQDIDTASKFFGRVPNIVNPNNIDYHTTDGTPRFILGLQDYVKYSGDTSIITELYPKIKNSIEGSLKYRTDSKGYLLHEDNETWMDARDQNLVSYSPRGSRANDIQALWYKQLLAGAYFADYMKDTANSAKWKNFASRLKNNFTKDFIRPDSPFLADRLTQDGQPDFSLRPNQLFALDMIKDTERTSKILGIIWKELVYPWGVATLNKQDPLFHPFHLTKDYPKDAAYHNGTIWPWLNGIAMQRMIENEQPEIAYRLFKKMNWQALNLGVVGGLSENMDAFPHKGQKWPTLTGAYLQAWSNAEHIRTWYQDFLGIRPDITINHLVLAPRVPEEIKDLKYNFFIGDHLYHGSYKRSEGKNKIFTYQFANASLDVSIDIFPYEINEVKTAPNSTLTILDNGENLLIRLTNQQGKIIKSLTLSKSKERIQVYKKYFKKLENTPFAGPDDLSKHKVIKDISQ